MTYVYQEYPKSVKDKDGNDVTVHDVAEEAKLTGKAQASVQKQADDKISEGEDAAQDLAERELQRLRDKGTDVSEDELASMTDLAVKIAAVKKLGRPSKADIAARDGK